MKISYVVLEVLLTFLFTTVSLVVTPVNSATVPVTDSSLTVINTSTAALHASPISQAIISGNHLYISGTLPLDSNTGSIIGDGDVIAQTLAVLQNLETIIEYTGSSLGKVVKVTVYLKNIEDYNIVNTVYAGFFGSHRPARSALAVTAIPLSGALVEMDAIVRI